MALNTSRCNRLTPLHFKGLMNSCGNSWHRCVPTYMQDKLGDSLVRCGLNFSLVWTLRLGERSAYCKTIVTSLMPVTQSSSYSSCSLSVQSFIITQLFSIVMLWSWTACWHFSWCFPLQSHNLSFLAVFPSIAIYALPRLILNLTTRCLAVTGSGSVGECSRLSWFTGQARAAYMSDADAYY